MNDEASRVDSFEVARGILQRLDALPSSLLPALHRIQDSLGSVPPEVLPLIAAGLNLSLAEVHGVVGFYPWFRREPAGRHTVRLCRSDACRARGADALAEHVERSLGCREHETSADGFASLEPMQCLGLCALGPAMMIDDEVHGRMTPEHFDRMMAELRRAP